MFPKFSYKLLILVANKTEKPIVPGSGIIKYRNLDFYFYDDVHFEFVFDLGRGIESHVNKECLMYCRFCGRIPSTILRFIKKGEILNNRDA